ncbi:MAG: hypothetical protein DCC49_07860 [Acidobacteria bacterium]|nr:MAG: hypothetical protein DCC49_07860 [Acidobacteriota bacterium]
MSNQQVVQVIIFGIAAALIIFGGIRVVTAQNIVRAALYLVLTLAATAGLFVLLLAEFIAAVQILIYVGAVVVILLFGIMLTRAPIGLTPDLDNESARIWGLVAGLVFLGVVTFVLWRHFASVPALELSAPDSGANEALGRSLLVDWVAPFEAVSMVLLSALIGALAMARKD